ncbi:unnamed protein product [Somion occarium]|uniref:Uncharacterized protein n=1 Tax=Somion occarium TaxID=3059160 RepID=A0ABP1CVC9_9APHY
MTFSSALLHFSMHTCQRLKLYVCTPVVHSISCGAYRHPSCRIYPVAHSDIRVLRRAFACRRQSRYQWLRFTSVNVLVVGPSEMVHDNRGRYRKSPHTDDAVSMHSQSRPRVSNWDERSCTTIPTVTTRLHATTFILHSPLITVFIPVLSPLGFPSPFRRWTDPPHTYISRISISISSILVCSSLTQQTTRRLISASLYLSFVRHTYSTFYAWISLFFSPSTSTTRIQIQSLSSSVTSFILHMKLGTTAIDSSRSSLSMRSTHSRRHRVSIPTLFLARYFRAVASRSGDEPGIGGIREGNGSSAEWMGTSQ